MASAPSSTCTICGSSVDTTLLAGACPRCMLGEIMQGLPEPGVAHFDGHELLGEIARGGMGVVHRARQHDPERIVALKTLRSASLDSPEAMARFKHEAEVMVALDHPAILPVYRCGDSDGIPYFTMKLVEGGTLGDRIDRFAGQWREIAELMAQVGDGVRHAHERGVLHRDLKPGNILFDSAGRSYVSDFGIAKLADSQTACLTMTMSMMGTPHYISPEVAAGGAQAASVSSDVWSLGVMLYELLTGQKPFKGATLTEVLRALEMEEPIAPRKVRVDVPRDLEVITLKALSRDRNHRYSSVQALVEDLRAWLEGRPIAARSVPPQERALMWARRNPRLAGTAALLALAICAAVASLVWGFVRVKQENVRVLASQANERARLRESLLTQAHAGRVAREMGWRSSGLKALREAYAIRPGDDVRDEAVVHLAGFDLELGGRLFAGNVHPSPSMDCYVQMYKGVSLRRMDDDTELFRLPIRLKSGSLQVAFDPRGRWLAVSVDEGAIVYSLDDHRELARWPGAMVQQTSEDGEFLPVQEKNRWVLRRTADWTVAAELPYGSTGPTTSPIQSSPHPGAQPLYAKGFVTAYSTGGVQVINWRTKTQVRRIELVGSPLDLTWLGDYIVANCRNDLGHAFDLRRERSVVLPQFSNAIFFSANRDSVFMLSSGYDAVTQLWHLPTGTRLVRGRGLTVTALATDDRRFVVTGPSPTSVIGTVVHPSCIRLLPDRQMTVAISQIGRTAALSPDGRLLVIRDRDKVAVHDVGTGKLLACQELGGVLCSGFSPDGRELWVAHLMGIKVFKLTRQGSKLVLVSDRELPPPEPGKLSNSLLYPGGAGIAVKMGDAGGAVYEWRAESAEWWRWVGPDPGRSNMFTKSRDGRWLASAPYTFFIFEASAPFKGRRISSGSSGRVCFSPDSRRLIFVDMSHQWSVFEAPDWHKVASSRTSDDPIRTNNITSTVEAAWGPDGSWFATVSDGVDIELVDTATWRTVARLHGPLELPVINLNVTADGSSIVVQRRDGPVEIWYLRKLEEEMRALEIELRLPLAVTPPPSPPDLAGPFEELVLPPLILKTTPGTKQ